MTYPMLEFRQSLQHIGLLRKYKGKLLLTTAGKAAQADPATLWEHLRTHLLDGPDDSFEMQSKLLALLALASEPEGRHEEQVAEALTYLGWSQRDGRPVSADTGRWAVREVTDALANIADVQRDRSIPRMHRRALSPAAVLMARAAVPDDDRSLLGPRSNDLATDRYARHLQRQVDALYPESVRRWEAQIAHAIGDPDHRDGRTLDLARELDRIQAGGLNAAQILRRAATLRRPLPDERKVEALTYRIERIATNDAALQPQTHQASRRSPSLGL